MPKNIREDIYDKTIDYTFLAINSKKLRVGVIGGGKAGLIKARTLLKKGCYIEILARSISDDLKKFSEKIKLIEGEYYTDFIKDKHLIIIAIDDYLTVKKIISDCEENFKIYINSSKFKEGLAVIPAQRSTKTTSVGVTTFSGNPKGAVMAVEAAKLCLKNYDAFLEFSGQIRNNAKQLLEYKNEIINFIVTEEFKEVWEKGKDKLMLKLFFDEKIVESLYK